MECLQYCVMMLTYVNGYTLYKTVIDSWPFVMSLPFIFGTTVLKINFVQIPLFAVC